MQREPKGGNTLEIAGRPAEQRKIWDESRQRTFCVCDGNRLEAGLADQELDKLVVRGDDGAYSCRRLGHFDREYEAKKAKDVGAVWTPLRTTSSTSSNSM